MTSNEHKRMKQAQELISQAEMQVTNAQNAKNLSSTDVDYMLRAYVESIICDQNELETLPPLPAALLFLSCDFNQLDTLPELPENLWFLSISHNQFQEC